jgi:hypothetical protein
MIVCARVMSNAHPGFTERVPIDAARSWTATFDSYNERTLDLYFIITTYEGDSAVGRFMASVIPLWSVESWDDPAYTADLRNALHAIAVAGHPNTEYRGWRPGALELPR